MWDEFDEFKARDKFEPDAMALKPLLSAMVFYINAIKDETDPELISIYIEKLQETNDKFPGDWKKKSDIKSDIRSGIGDFAKIQKKCIELGLV